MKVFKKGNYLQINFDSGNTYETHSCSIELWDFIANNIDKESCVENQLLQGELNEASYKNRILNSKILTLRGNSVYMLDISELSIPMDLVNQILIAEDNNDITKINSYKNFWTLVSLNPDSRVRNNIFWFIKTWGINITEAGMLVCYRNADIFQQSKYTKDQVKDIINSYYEEKYIKGKNPKNIILNDVNLSLEEAYNSIINEDAGSPIFTDRHSGTTRIVLGKPVKIPREQCDAEQENSCSRGLHCAAKGWLKQNYYGDVGLVVLVNPAKIVAVPTIDQYGKLRTCEYLPIAIAEFDDSGDIIEPKYSLYNDINYLKQLQYEGTINNEDIDHYTIASSREDMYKSILERLQYTKLE